MYALIEKETNKILRIGSEGSSLSDAKPFYWVECPDGCNAGWSYDGTTFTAPPVPQPPPPQPPAIPSVVSMRQARLALLQQNLLATVDAAIAAGNEADKITWEYATEVNRSDALVANLAAGLGLTETDLDNLFTLAATL